MLSKSRIELLDNLRRMLRDVFELRAKGVAYPKLARAHGYVDGYMRVLLEAGLFDQKALLAVIAEERQVHDGPATRAVGPETAPGTPRAA